MADREPPDTLNVRLPLYAYTSALWRGRRVLEIGCGGGSSAAYLAVHGAADVVSLDVDAERIDRARAQHARPGIHYLLLDDLQQIGALSHRFDVVLIPDAEAILAAPGLLSRIKGLLRDDGFLVVAVAASERQSAFFHGGVGFYDLSDALTRDFRAVRMLGQTPFLGFGLIEFDTGSDGLRVDVSLLGGGTEQPSHYVAIAGNTASPALGQALVQVPFAPIEALAEAATAAPPPSAALMTRAGGAAISEAEREIARLKVEVAEARLVAQGPGNTVELIAATTRADLAERRLDEIERRARVRADEADTRMSDLRRKLEDALVASESAVRVSRAQGDEIEELRARLRRAAEDRALADTELGKLRRALAEADDSVLTLTRRTAEEMAVVAQRLVTGLGSAAALGGGTAPSAAPVSSGPQPSPELEGKLRRAEEALARSEAESAAVSERLRGADEEIRALKRQTAELGTRDDRIARLEGDKQDLLWRVAEMEEKLRNVERDAVAGRAPPEEIATARASRDRAIEEFHRAAAAHVNEVNRLQAAVSEHAALVAELEDSLRAAEARAAAADKEATSLRRAAKELEESDRARRGRLSELEGKLLRVERERAMSAAAEASGEGGKAADAEVLGKLQSAEQRAGVLEQRLLASDEAVKAAAARMNAAEEAARTATERAAAAEEKLEGRLKEGLRSAAARADAAEEGLRSAERRAAEAAEAQRRAEDRVSELERSRAAAVERAAAAGERAAAAEARLLSAPVKSNGSGNGNAGGRGAHLVGDVSSGEILSVIEDAEARLRDEVRALGRIEETLGRAEQVVAQATSPAELADRDRTIAAKDAQLVAGRLELARVRREGETARVQLENEIADLRARLGAGAGGAPGGDSSLSAQLILMHSTMGNIRRRAARLRDELEGFRRRIDTLPPGALASMLEEIGDDLGEFAK